VTDWITIRHENAMDPETGKSAGKGTGATARVPKGALKVYEAKGWKQVKDDESAKSPTPEATAAKS
jgi:hypothetical protein